MLPLLLSLLLSLLLAPANATPGCVPVGLPQLRSAPTPVIFVLGASPTSARDLRRAARLGRTLQARGVPVTVALEALPVGMDPKLASLVRPEPDLDVIKADLGWSQMTDLPYDAYRPLLALGLKTHPDPVTLVTVGQPAWLPPIDVVPSPLPQRLTDLAGPDLPFVVRQPLAAARAATDAAIADAAIKAWSGQGALLIVADRTRVAGEGGLAFHVAQRTRTRVQALTLDWREQDCVDDTWQWYTSPVGVRIPGVFPPPQRTE